MRGTLINLITRKAKYPNNSDHLECDTGIFNVIINRLAHLSLYTTNVIFVVVQIYETGCIVFSKLARLFYNVFF